MNFCIRVSVTLDGMETAPTRPLTVSPLMLVVLQASKSRSGCWQVKSTSQHLELGMAMVPGIRQCSASRCCYTTHEIASPQPSASV